MDVEEIKCECVSWIHFPQDRVLWQTVVNTAINLVLHKRKERLLSPYEGLLFARFVTYVVFVSYFNGS